MKKFQSQESKIEFIHIVENAIDDLGEKIESIFPLLATLDPESEEFYLLNKIWIDWCRYIDYG